MSKQLKAEMRTSFLNVPMKSFLEHFPRPYLLTPPASFSRKISSFLIPLCSILGITIFIFPMELRLELRRLLVRSWHRG